jgi:hypothetical protein
MTRALALALSSLLALTACAPDPCARRCANDPEPSSSNVSQCRDVQARISAATGPCAVELRAATSCLNVNTACNASGRAELDANACSTQTNALVQCCLANLGRAPACAVR